MSKRAENGKKTITKSMKLSPDAVQYIEGEAEKLNMNFSQYMLDCVMHRECSFVAHFPVLPVIALFFLLCRNTMNVLSFKSQEEG